MDFTLGEEIGFSSKAAWCNVICDYGLVMWWKSKAMTWNISVNGGGCTWGFCYTLEWLGDGQELGK